MNIRDIFITLRYKISYGSTVEWYNFWYIVLRKKRKIIPQVASIDETIRKIIDDRCSVSRFGDGEVLLTSPDKEIRFQKGDPLLAKRLTEVLQSHEEGHIVCISDAFRDLYRYNRKSRRFSPSGCSRDRADCRCSADTCRPRCIKTAHAAEASRNAQIQAPCAPSLRAQAA